MSEGAGKRRRERRGRARAHLRHRRQTEPGAPPGTLAVPPGAPPARLTVTAYGPEGVEIIEDASLADVHQKRGRVPVLWVDVEGFGDGSLIAALGERFRLHRLTLEDVVNTHQRPKVEDYDSYLFIVTRMARRRPPVETDQLALFLLEGVVLSFHERPTEGFVPIRRRLARDGSGLRNSGPDYLVYALLDTVVDGYFPVLEDLGERLEALEERVAEAVDESAVHDIHAIKHDLLALRRAVWPQRELMSALARGDDPLITDATRIFLRDCYDHVVQLMDVIETAREVAAGLVELYMSGLSNRLNEVMKVLTIIATVFIPLGFIAGVYGMNFDREVSPWNMPELGWRFGYPFALGLMAAIAIGLVYYFKRKGWIGRR